MLNGRLISYCWRSPMSDSINLGLAVEHHDGTLSTAQPIAFKKREDDYIEPPALTMRKEEAQRLMDELWQCGLRPSEGSGSAGSLAATERHLKDMQAIAMGLLRKEGVDLPLDKPKTGA